MCASGVKKLVVGSWILFILLHILPVSALWAWSSCGHKESIDFENYSVNVEKQGEKILVVFTPK